MVFDWRWRNGLGISSGVRCQPSLGTTSPSFPWSSSHQLSAHSARGHLSQSFTDKNKNNGWAPWLAVKKWPELQIWDTAAATARCCSGYPKVHISFMSTCSEYVAACSIAVYWLLYFLHEWLRKTPPIDLLLGFRVDRKCLLYLKFGNKINVTVHLRWCRWCVHCAIDGWV